MIEFIKQFPTKRIWSKKKIMGRFQGIALEFLIPDEHKLKVFSFLNPFHDYKDLNQKYFDLHEQDCFYCHQIKVIFDNSDRKFKLINPFFPEGGSLIDWFEVSPEFNPNELP